MRAAVELLEVAVRCASPESTIRVVVAPVAVEIAYEGDRPPEDSLVVCLVRAVAECHGGTFSGADEDGSVRLTLSLLGE
jgi:hypothetical protein